MGRNRFEAKKKEVIRVLNENPELLSSQLALETQLSFDELQEVYLQIKGKIPSIDERTFGIQNFFRQVLEADVLSDRKRLEKFGVVP